MENWRGIFERGLGGFDSEAQSGGRGAKSWRSIALRGSTSSAVANRLRASCCLGLPGWQPPDDGSGKCIERIPGKGGVSLSLCAIRGLARRHIQGWQQPADVLHVRGASVSWSIGRNLKRKSDRGAVVASAAFQTAAGYPGLPGSVHRSRREKVPPCNPGGRQRKFCPDGGRVGTLCSRGRDHRLFIGSKQNSLRNQSGSCGTRQIESELAAAGTRKDGHRRSHRDVQSCSFALHPPNPNYPPLSLS